MPLDSSNTSNHSMKISIADEKKHDTKNQLLSSASSSSTEKINSKQLTQSEIEEFSSLLLKGQYFCYSAEEIEITLLFFNTIIAFLKSTGNYCSQCFMSYIQQTLNQLLHCLEHGLLPLHYADKRFFVQKNTSANLTLPERLRYNVQLQEKVIELSKVFLYTYHGYTNDNVLKSAASIVDEFATGAMSHSFANFQRANASSGSNKKLNPNHQYATSFTVTMNNINLVCQIIISEYFYQKVDTGDVSYHLQQAKERLVSHAREILYFIGHMLQPNRLVLPAIPVKDIAKNYIADLNTVYSRSNIDRIYEEHYAAETRAKAVANEVESRQLEVTTDKKREADTIVEAVEESQPAAKKVKVGETKSTIVVEVAPTVVNTPFSFNASLVSATTTLYSADISAAGGGNGDVGRKQEVAEEDDDIPDIDITD